MKTHGPRHSKLTRSIYPTLWIGVAALHFAMLEIGNQGCNIPWGCVIKARGGRKWSADASGRWSTHRSASDCVIRAQCTRARGAEIRGDAIASSKRCRGEGNHRWRLRHMCESSGSRGQERMSHHSSSWRGQGHPPAQVLSINFQATASVKTHNFNNAYHSNILNRT